MITRLGYLQKDCHENFYVRVCDLIDGHEAEKEQSVSGLTPASMTT